MTDDERAEILITTRLLRACAPLPWLATFLIAVAVFSLQREASIPLVISIAAGVVALIYGIRSVFDRGHARLAQPAGFRDRSFRHNGWQATAPVA